MLTVVAILGLELEPKEFLALCVVPVAQLRQFRLARGGIDLEQELCISLGCGAQGQRRVGSGLKLQLRDGYRPCMAIMKFITR